MSQFRDWRCLKLDDASTVLPPSPVQHSIPKLYLQFLTFLWALLALQGVSEEISRFTALRQLSLAGLRPGCGISCGHLIATGGGPTRFHDTLVPLLALTQLSRLCLRHCVFSREPLELQYLPALAVSPT